MHYVWKYRLYADTELATTEGFPVEVIDPGIQNANAGPDFFNAKIRIGDTLWAGNVEIHRKSSEWRIHRHDRNPAYNSVILHVVEECDELACHTDGTVVPHMTIRVPPKVVQNMEWLLSHDKTLPCSRRICEIDPLHISAWMSALLTERMERKTEDVFALLNQYTNDWNEVFYITLMRNFGFGVNSDAFEWLAKSLPYKCILKQRCNSLQIEALLFGQAGLLNDDYSDAYYQSLQREYGLLRIKYGLQPLEKSLFKTMRTRPVNFPHLRLAQLAAIWVHNDMLFPNVLECTDLKKLRDMFNVTLSEYWDTHYHFKGASPARQKRIGANAAYIVMINTVVPILFAYGKKRQQPDYCARALQALEKIPPERNSLVSDFVKAGIRAENASDTQALIQLGRAYCEKKKCLYCRIGFRLIKSVRPDAP